MSDYSNPRIPQLCRTAVSAATAHSLHGAFKCAKLAASAASDPVMLRHIETIESGYRQMLYYFAEGANDPQREAMRDSVAIALIDAARQMTREHQLPLAPQRYFAEARMQRYKATTIEAAVKDFENEPSYRAGSVLFNVTFTTFPLSSGDAEILSNLLKDDSKALWIRSLVVSALLLGSLAFFEPRTLKLLVEAYPELDMKLRAQAMVAILLLCSVEKERVGRDRKLQKRLDSLLDDPEWRNEANTAMHNLMSTCDTDRVSRKITNEVMPDLMKMQPELRRRMKDIIGSSDLADLQENPEWEEMLDSTGITNKLRELTDLQMEGADVMAVTFAALKNFPFFQQIGNWLLPFSPDHPELAAGDASIKSELAGMLSNSDMLCDSDKYSMVLSLDRVPEAQKAFLKKQLSAQIDALKEAAPEAEGKSRAFEIASLKYLRNLYRFFRGFKGDTGLTDPFSHPIGYADLPAPFSKYVTTNDLLGGAEFYFNRKHYDSAKSMYLALVNRGEGDGSLFEKLGYCFQTAGDHHEALKYYKRAEVEKPEGLWLLKRLAALSRERGDYSEALKYFERIMALKPENLSMTMAYANTLLESGQPELALKQYYKADYLKEENAEAWRGVAWCEFLLGHFERSKSYYDRLLLISPLPNDYLNAGHVALASKNYKEAIALYKQFANSPDSGVEAFVKAIEEDAPTLRKLGVSDPIMELIQDKVAFDVED